MMSTKFTGWIAVAVLGVVLLGSAALCAADVVTWDGGPGGLGTDWDTAENWDPDGVPTNADQAVLNSGTINKWGVLNVDGGIGHVGSVDHNGGDLTTDVVRLGFGGGAAYTISGGSITGTSVNDGVSVGNFGATDALMTIEGTAHISTADHFYASMGYDDLGNWTGTGGTGKVVQTGGTVAPGKDLRVGIIDGGNGTYEISGGAISVLSGTATMYVGQKTGIGEFKVIGTDASINLGNYRHANDLGTLSVVLDDHIAFSTINVSGVVDLAGMFEIELDTELPGGEYDWTIINKTSDGGITTSTIG